MTEHIEIALKAVQLYADMHPRPSCVTQSQAAEMIGVSRSTMRKLVTIGKVKLNDLGMVPITEVDRVLAPRAA